MLFTARAPSVLTSSIQHVGQYRRVTEGQLVHAQGFFSHFEHADAFDTAWCATEIFLDHVAVQTNGLEQLGAAVTHVGGYTHLGHDFGQPFANRFDVVGNGLVRRQVARQLRVHALKRLHCEVGVDRLSTVASQHREVMDLARRRRLDDQACRRPHTLTHQVLVDRGHGEQRGNSYLRFTDALVTDDQDVATRANRVHSLCAQGGQLRLDTLTAPAHRVGDVQCMAAELTIGVRVDIAQFGHVLEGQHGLRDLESHGWIHLIDVQQVWLGANEGHQGHHDRFTDWVDRRVGDLCKQLFEVVVQRLATVGQNRQRAVVAH